MNSLLNIPNHVIVRKLGEGGMGTVWLALDGILQRHVAIKALKQSVQSDSMSRFRSEAVTLARLRHPNITMLYNLVQSRGNWCMLMEYVDGENLESRLKSHGSLSVGETLFIAIQTLGGLQHAHDKGVVHRDLKPSNLMISSDGEVKITDFGIARISGNSRLTRAGQAVGTPQYMSPEQVKGQEGDRASDIYSLGVVMYELLTGVTPFASESEFETMQAHIRRRPTPPANINKSIPSALNAAIMKALEKNPAHRFVSAAAFMTCLEAIAASEKAQLSAPRWTPPRLSLQKSVSGMDRQYLFGTIFLVVSVSIALFLLLFYYSSGTEKPPVSELPDIHEKPLAETVEDDYYTRSQTSTHQPETFLPSVPPVKDSPAKDEKPKGGGTAGKSKSDGNKAKSSKTPDRTPPATVKTDSDKTPLPQTVPDIPKTEGNAGALSKTIVIQRGMQIWASLADSYDYDTATDGTRVILLVTEATLRSNETVIPAGAKVYAILHKNSRRRELTLEMTEVESITGQRLKTLSTTYKADAFAQGQRLKVFLEYNRITGEL